MKKLLRNLYFILLGKPEQTSSKAYLDYLRKKGIKLGTGIKVLDPCNIRIDVTRPELVEIGNNVFLHYGTTIMTHDWASWCFVKKNADFLPSHGRIRIGNNVWLGQNVTILKNVSIGDNVIIGAGSVVTKSIPSDSVAVGIPAKVIYSIKEYYEKRKEQYADEVIDYALSIYEHGREPRKEDFYDDYPAFVDGSNWREYDYPYNRIFTIEQFEKWKKNHHAPYHGWEEFLAAVNERRNQK